MASQIDPSKPADGVPAVKSDLRGNLQAAKDEIEALQSEKAPLGHGHALAEISDAGALAARDLVGTADIEDGAVTGSKLASDALDGRPIDMAGALLTAPEIKDYSETSPTPASVGGTLILDLRSGNVFEVVLTEEVTSLVLANPPAAGRARSLTLILKQDSAGGRSFTWPPEIKWAEASPAISSAADAIDVYGLVTRDGGTTWYGFVGGKGFS